MNPDTAIRPWLRACGRLFGVNEVHNYHWPDASTRQQEAFFTYRVLRASSGQDGVQTSEAASGYTSTITGWEAHQTVVRVDLYRSINGVQELAKCCVAARFHEPIKAHFKNSGCAFSRQLTEIEDLTPEYDALTAGDITDQLHQRVDVLFNDNISVSFSETNNVVETVTIDLGL